jgi:transcriptional regulator with XRE-family HTH domain
MKIPDNAFETYVAMGTERSYQALADKLGVDKRSISRLATKERWVERLSKIQEEARAATDRKLVQDLQAVREQQLREVRFLRAEAIKAMKGLTPERAVKLASALNIAWKHELFLLGEPTDRQATTIEEITKREIQTLLRPVVDEGEEDEPDEGSEDGPRAAAPA